MFQKTSRVSAMLALSFAASAVLIAVECPVACGAPDQDVVELPLGSEPDMLYIRFKDTISPEEGMVLLSNSSSPDFVPALDGAQWVRSTGDLKHSDVAAMHVKAEEKLGRDLPDPWQGVYVNLKKGVGAAEAIAAVRETGFAVKTLPVPTVTAMPLMSSTIHRRERHLLPAEDYGIGAQAVWDRYGITGEGVAVCDVEFTFSARHCELPEVEVLGELCPRPGAMSHGTAALGCVVALADGRGTTGIAHGVDRVLFSPGAEQYEHDGQQRVRGIVDRAVFRAIRNLDAGDVLYFEIGIYGPNWNGNPNSDIGGVPLEWYEPYYDAIVMAVAHDIIVIQPAGNGSQDLDWPVYSEGNGGHWPFLLENDSGAIMVGAGGNREWDARQRKFFSNYGATVDVQGWGSNVCTAGYNHFAIDNCPYTDLFGGTSAASAIVAGSAALLQSYVKNRWGRTLTPAEMKQVLRQTGQPQDPGNDDVIRNIGPLPDLVAATDYFESLTPLHRVPEDHATIQEAVDAAGNGDTIEVGPGAWAGFEVERKSLIIQGTEGKEFTFVDGSGVNTCVRCLDSSVEIEGFTIHDCRAENGAGLYSDGDRLTVRDCVFRDNLVTSSGAGIWSNTEWARITRCEFTSNRAWFAGAGLHVFGGSTEVTDSTFRSNVADNGGGLCSRSDRCWIVNSVFEDNEARFTGGGVDLWQGEVDVMECRFDGNSSNRGGGLSMSQGSSGNISDCVFNGNMADLQGAGCWIDDAIAWFMQCHFSGNIAVNTGGGIQSSGVSVPEVKSSVLCGNLPTAVDGPIHDAGENCFANDCEDNNNNGRPDECDLVEGDVTGDGDVDIEDLLAIISAYGPCMGCAEDVNGDGVVDIEDLLAVLACWRGDC
ncbi:MAG: S8 family serine peptidase [Phycisphaerales bacterium]|nr:S8 family serine peptidase [Phycisphaerales bacterium]